MDPKTRWPPNRRAWWEPAARRVVSLGARAFPPRPALALIDHCASACARIALRTKTRLLPSSIQDFPDALADRYKLTLSPEERNRLVRDRLRFILTRIFITQTVRGESIGTVPRRVPLTDVRGLHHLEEAVAGGRGALLISAHFGLPPLIRSALAAAGARSVGVGGFLTLDTHVAFAGDALFRARVLRKLQHELASGHACVVLVDSLYGRYQRVPFLGDQMPVSLGAFTLAQSANCPLLPFFAFLDTGALPLRVDITPPLTLAGDPNASVLTAVDEFARRYEPYARSHLSQLRGYLPLFVS